MTENKQFGISEQLDDMISRQAVLDEIHKYMEERDYTIGTLHDNICEMPSAQPEQQWIPCSERLPEDYTDVLVWFEYYRYGDYNCLYQMHGIGNYMAEYDSWMINHETGWRELRVFAWMPLPAPWKGERDG